MNKGELIEVVAKKAELPKTQIGKIIDEILGVIKKNMKTKRVQLIGFGTFESVRRKKRQGVNPATGKKITIPAKRVPKFRPGQAMKDAVK